MSNLIKRAEDVRNLMQQYSDIGAERERLQVLTTRTKMIRDIRVKFDEAQASVSILRDAGVPLRPLSKASSALIMRCKKVRADFDKNWEKTVRETSIKTNLIDPASDHIDRKIQKNLRDEWRAYVDERAPKFTKASLAPLSSSGFGDAVDAISKLLDEISGLRDDLPQDRASISRVQEAANEASELFEELEKIPEAARNFLAKAARGDALITDLSDEVKAWLAEHQMLEQLRIQFG